MQTIDTPPSTLDETRGQKAHRLILDSDYPGSCKAVLRALVVLMDERDWSQSQTAKKIKHGERKRPISTAALSQLLGGTYRADPEALCRSIARTIDHERGRAIYADGEFAETALYRSLVQLADLAVITQRIACLHGPSLCGKTTCAIRLAETYQRAAAIYMACPYADTYGGFVRRLARLRGVSLRGTLSDIREAILDSLDGSHLLVLDEFHQPLVAYARVQCRRVLEFIREIHDRSRTPVLLIGASAGYALLSTAPEYERLHRGLYSLDAAATGLLPANPQDVATVARTFGLDLDARDLRDAVRIVQDHGVQRLYDLLRLARGNIADTAHALAWRHVSAIADPTLRLAA